MGYFYILLPRKSWPCNIKLFTLFLEEDQNIILNAIKIPELHNA
jgi:hypothetical protein